MRIQTTLSAFLCLISLFFFSTSPGLAFGVDDESSLANQEKRAVEADGGATAEAKSQENQQKTEPVEEQALDYQDDGAIKQAGVGSGGALSPPSQNPTTQARAMKDGKYQVNKEQWSNYKTPDKQDDRGPPKKDPFHVCPQCTMNIETGNPFTEAYGKNFNEQNNPPGGIAVGSDVSTALSLGATIMGDQANDPHGSFDKAQAAGQGACQGAGDAMADAFDPTWLCMLDLQNETLINVANERSGSAASSLQPTKTHQNAVWFVQRMYQQVYLPMAVLLLLPGAVITHTKGFVAHGVMFNSNDDDGVSPFTGILRSIIAIFLIPATQLILSWTIDVGNSMHMEVNRYVDPGIIFLWADEQVFRAPIQNAAKSVQNPSMFKVLGKLSQGAEDASGVEAQSAATVMLQLMANSMAQSAAFGLVMLCAFQITMCCYLFLMGPIAAAFYAWPGNVGSLFSRIFPVWVDAVINLSLWKFWWTVVLLCICTRLSWLGGAGGFSMYSEWELLMFLAFLIILTYVPFNPFDFKAGDMVSQVMQKAEQAVGEASKKGGG